MSAPIEIQFKQLEQLIASLEMSIPVYCHQHDDGSVQVDAGNAYVIRDGDRLDSFLNELIDIDREADPDILLDDFLRMLDPYCDI